MIIMKKRGLAIDEKKYSETQQTKSGTNIETVRESDHKESFAELFRGQKFDGDRTEKNSRAVVLSNGSYICFEKVKKVVELPDEIKIFQIDSPEFFREALSIAQKTSSHGAYVALRDLEEYKDTTLFISEHGATGIAVDKDGHIFSLFKNCNVCKEIGLKSVAAKMMFTAISNGGKKIDCFDGFLPNLYTTFGFEPVTKIKFSEDLTSGAKWNKKRDGEPDLIFMKHNGQNIDKIIENMGFYRKYSSYKIPYSKDFDTAESILDQKLNIEKHMEK
jgi:hypothetical protein